MTDMTEAFDRMAQGIRDLAEQLAAELTPAISRLAYALHVHLWLPVQPWYVIWWHTVTGHRNPSRVERTVRRWLDR